MAIKGKNGGVYIGAAKIAELSLWNLDLGSDDIDVTTFDSDGWKEFLAGLKEWGGSGEGNFAPTDTAGQVALLNAWLNGTTVALSLKVSDTLTFSGDAFIKPAIETPVDDKVAFSFDYQGTGSLALPV